MNQYNRNKIDGRRTWPRVEKGMYFYVPVGVVLFDLKECSDYETGIESKSLLHGGFVPSNDTMTNKDYTFLAAGNWR